MQNIENTLITCFKQEPRVIRDEDELKVWIRDKQPAMEFGSIRDKLRELRKRGRPAMEFGSIRDKLRELRKRGRVEV
jgi:hypothetical protein